MRPSAPVWLLTLLAAALVVAFIQLGRWQWYRGAASAASREAFARGADAVEVLGSSKLGEVARFARVSTSGHYRADRQFLLDNRTHNGAPGYEVLTPLELTDGRIVLVDRGWVAFTGSRARLPDVSLAESAPLELSGRVAALPRAGLASGRAAPTLTGPWPRVTSFPTPAELSAAFGAPLEARILLLDPTAPAGLVREWQPPGMSPLRHLAYAIQWWCFAALALIVWAVLGVRRARAARARP